MAVFCGYECDCYAGLGVNCQGCIFKLLALGLGCLFRRGGQPEAKKAGLTRLG